MKKLLNLFCVAIIAVSAMFVSCSSDSNNGDDSAGGPLDTPKYESSSALYNITDANSAYKSIEFTASGNYVITKNTGSRAAAPTFISPIDATRSVTYQNIIYGTYTKNGDTYVLDGFGTITVKGGANNAVSLDITTTDGTQITVGAQPQAQYSSSTKTNMLCRTWIFSKIRVSGSYQGTSFDRTFNTYEEYDKEMRGGDGGSVYPQQVIFTKSGTYVVFYTNGMLAVSTWKWDNEEAGTARYSWNYESLNDPSKSGTINIAFEGSQLLITESVSGGQGTTISVVYYLVEVQ